MSLASANARTVAVSVIASTSDLSNRSPRMKMSLEPCSRADSWTLFQRPIWSWSRSVTPFGPGRAPMSRLLIRISLIIVPRNVFMPVSSLLLPTRIQEQPQPSLHHQAWPPFPTGNCVLLATDCLRDHSRGHLHHYAKHRQQARTNAWPSYRPALRLTPLLVEARARLCVFSQPLGRCTLANANVLAVERVRVPSLHDDAGRGGDFQKRAREVHALSILDQHLGLLERRADLVLLALHLRLVGRLLAVDYLRARPGHLHDQGGVEPRTLSAGNLVRVAELNADLLADLTD